MAKTYWQVVSLTDEGDIHATKAWFAPLCDDMTPIKAEILYDIETDKEKKLRVLMRDVDGSERVATRTLGRNFTIALSRKS